VGPWLVVDFPDPGICLSPALGYRTGCDLGRLLAAGVKPALPGGRREQEQCLAERVELELPVDPVADQVEAAGIAGQVQPALVGHPAAADGIGLRKPRPIRMESV
jgi:hypothetical protein